MKRRDTLLLIAAGLAIMWIASRWVSVPGYMDADYYYAGGLRLAQGYGLSEPFVWNYLDNPQTLPHPAFGYWMPLPALLAAVGMLLTNQENFVSARLTFLLLSAVLPALTAWLSYRLTGQRRTALLAGIMALFPGFYLPYLLTIESFGLYMLAGTLFIWTIYPDQESIWSRLPAAARFVVLGVLAGLLHLSRADGVLWLLAVLGVVGLDILARARQGEKWLLPALDAFIGILFGYALVTAFWYLRNLIEYGALMAPGGSKTLWLTEYNQTFTSDPAALNPRAWLASGWQSILEARFSALLGNLKTWVGVQGAIVLWPLALLGLWSLRGEKRVRFAVVMWLGILAFFTFVFPFAGARGGFFHSGAAFQPLIWCAAATGFSKMLAWGVRRRGWGEIRSWRMFAPALAVLLVVFTGAQFVPLVIGPDANHPLWRSSWDAYQDVEGQLISLGARPLDSVMVNNPPGYFAAAGRSAVVIPADEQAAVLKTARRFGVTYLILDENSPPQLLDRYNQPGSDNDLLYLRPVGKAQIYKVRYPT